MNNRAWYVQSRPIIREGSLEGTGRHTVRL